MAENESTDSTRTRLIAGAMSGTSGDGVDVAITQITGRGLGMSAKLVQHHHVPYEAPLKRLLFEIRETGATKLSDLARLGREISLTYARAVNDALSMANLRATDLAAVAAHGQTLYHEPPNSIQWFDPSLVAAEVGCAVVSDFRRADLGAGGQGAPLVPFADYILFRHPTKNRLLLNIGGIANITYLKAGASIDDVIAFDTGPGNCISDWICRTRGPFGLSWDAEGAMASRGVVNKAVAEQVMKRPFFAASAPKSTDAPEMIDAFQHASAANKFGQSRMEDQLATSVYLTAHAIHDAVQHSGPIDEVIASGGGTENRAMMGWLRSLLGNTLIRVAPDSASKEAIAFALLGAATLDGEPSNVPSVTGAAKRVVLGSTTPSPSGRGSG
jgi:anhydro-N-acetylmuramic acid kinase